MAIRPEEMKVDRTAIALMTFEEAEAADRAYWWSRTPLERLDALEYARQIIYGYGPNPPRLHRVITLVER